MRGKILIVEDDPLMADMITRYLEREGFNTKWAKTGSQARDLFRIFKPDVIVLDLMLPDEDGFEICKDLSKSEVMILILTARDSDEDKIVGLEIGADDYMIKPFNMRELIARIKALLRRKTKVRSSAENMIVDDFEIRENEMKILVRGKPLDLTPKEFLILKKLLLNRGKVLSRDQIARDIYGIDVPDYDRIVDTYIYRIRTKLLEIDKSLANRIKTVRGVGYRFE